MDFTISIYRELLNNLTGLEYNFQTLSRYLSGPADHSIILRHDVDARKHHSLKFAQIQHELGIVSTYYFRMVPQSYDKEVIKEISSLGHEIGYHYETMDKADGDVEKAFHLFCIELEQLRKIVPIKTICMHGSPLSKYDNRDLWKHYDYHKLDIIGEPYFDLDFKKVLYLTDTGRRWNGDKMSIRDKAPEKQLTVEGQESAESGIHNSPTHDSQPMTHDYQSTQDIIKACKNDELPDQIMFNFHPQRWTDNKFLWSQELVLQNVKNVVKRAIVFFQ